MFTSGLLPVSLIYVGITQSWSVLFCQISFEIVKCEFFNLILFFKAFFFFFPFCWNPWISGEFSRWSGPRWASWVPSLWPRNSTTSSPGLWPIQSLLLWLLFLTASLDLVPSTEFMDCYLTLNVSSQLLSVPLPLWPQGLNPVLVPFLTLPLRLRMSLSSRSLSFQEAAELEFLSVNYTLQKWKGTALSQRALYWNIMLENCCSLAPLGNDSAP